MDFRYNDEQLAMQATLQRFIERDYGFTERRALAASASGFSTAAWTQYAQLGLLALPLPQQFDGLGGGAFDVMVVMEQVGRGLLLEPYLTTVVLCAGLVADAAPPAMQQALLPQVAAAQCKLALAAYEPASRYELAQVATTATRSTAGWQLSGFKAVVLDAPSADAFIVSAREAEGDGLSLFLVPRTAAGLTVSSYPTQSGARAGDVQLAKVSVGADALIGTVGGGLAPLEKAVDVAIAALCAEALGIMSALNQATLAYLKTRKQFGVAIGAFQALQHRMADMYIAEEQARSMAIIAADRVAGADAAARRRAVAAAKAYIGQAARQVGQEAVQLHGGMGVVDELIVSHYFKRLSMIEQTFGDTDYHLARFAQAAPVP
ncbi:MAG: acyl-CoA dehydrogenase family protein [Proteobacteria bacterium]|nr:acyl-CoA dehydrogenase family protein [Pseudomonadota bacterium]